MARSRREINLRGTRTAVDPISKSSLTPQNPAPFRYSCKIPSAKSSQNLSAVKYNKVVETALLGLKKTMTASRNPTLTTACPHHFPYRRLRRHLDRLITTARLGYRHLLHHHRAATHLALTLQHPLAQAQ